MINANTLPLNNMINDTVVRFMVLLSKQNNHSVQNMWE